MSPLFCEIRKDIIQGRTLYKGGHYLRKYGNISKKKVKKDKSCDCGNLVSRNFRIKNSSSEKK